MVLASVLFTTYASILLISAFLIAGSKNPVHSVLFMVMCFFCASSLLIMLSMEFVALLLLVIYVGAIAVMFLFVVMMMNIKVTVSNFNVLRYLPVGGLLGLLFLVQLGMNVHFIGVSEVDRTWYTCGLEGLPDLFWSNWFVAEIERNSIYALGKVLYTYTYDIFLLCSVILLVAMVAAILLTLHNTSKRQYYIEEMVAHVTKITFSK